MVKAYEVEKKVEEIQKIADMVATGQPDIVFVALGSPKQELLVEQIRKVRPSAWWLGVFPGPRRPVSISPVKPWKSWKLVRLTTVAVSSPARIAGRRAGASVIAT